MTEVGNICALVEAGTGVARVSLAVFSIVSDLVATTGFATAVVGGVVIFEEEGVGVLGVVKLFDIDFFRGRESGTNGSFEGIDEIFLANTGAGFVEGVED